MAADKIYIQIDVNNNMREITRLKARNPTAAALKAVTIHKSEYDDALPDFVTIIDESKTKLFVYTPKSFIKTTGNVRRNAVRVQRTQYINLLEEKAKWLQSRSELQIWRQ